MNALENDTINLLIVLRATFGNRNALSCFFSINGVSACSSLKLLTLSGPVHGESTDTLVHNTMH